MTSYVHKQNIPAQEWEFEHNLGTTDMHQSVWVHREDGMLCSMTIHWMAIDELSAIATFTTPCTGKVVLTTVEVPDGRDS